MALVSIRDLRRLREGMGLTREAAAEKLGVSVSALQRAEEANRNPSWRLIRRAALLYGEVNVDAPEGAFCLTHVYRPRMGKRRPTLDEGCEAALVLARFLGHEPVPRTVMGYLLEEIAAESAEAELAVTGQRKSLLRMFGAPAPAPPGEGEEKVFTEAVLDPLGPMAAGFAAYVTQHRDFARMAVEKRMARACSRGAAPVEVGA
ncbi:MAG: helix-turn-helix domain-containing protein [Bacteroidota bacterium]